MLMCCNEGADSTRRAAGQETGVCVCVCLVMSSLLLVQIIDPPQEQTSVTHFSPQATVTGE